ncbi:hypothetical protein C0995_005654 [Termitomyces sp. Mi166|nr:hypothetical protein C0995_005654 [Termitomyces sp. Mi166\
MTEAFKSDKNVSVKEASVLEGSVSIRNADDLKLAELGYKSEFRREFSLFETIAFAFSIMALIASVSSTMEFGLINGGHVGLVFGWFIPSVFVMTVALSLAELTSSMPTSAGLYYFSSKLAPPEYAPLASWITGWANITGQIALMCSIDFNCAQMITSAISVASDGATNLSSGATYGILLAILVSHDDSAAHISEETAGASKTAPTAILVGVAATAGLGWILLIVISFVIPSTTEILRTKLPLPMAQVLLDVLGKRGMLAIWSFTTVVQALRKA